MPLMGPSVLRKAMERDHRPWDPSSCRSDRGSSNAVANFRPVTPRAGTRRIRPKGRKPLIRYTSAQGAVTRDLGFHLTHAAGLMIRLLMVGGLLLTLLGATLLFFYGLPKMKIGNVIVLGDAAMKYPADPDEGDVPDEDWKPVALKFVIRAQRLNRSGFALIALGTGCQIIATWLASE